MEKVDIDGRWALADLGGGSASQIVDVRTVSLEPVRVSIA
jgi:hypothetical protein